MAPLQPPVDPPSGSAPSLSAPVGSATPFSLDSNLRSPAPWRRKTTTPLSASLGSSQSGSETWSSWAGSTRSIVRRLGPGCWRHSVESPGAIKAAAVFEWMETHLWIVDKAGERLPFHFNAAQIALSFAVAQAWHDDLPVRILVPKGRQMGISTWIEGLAVALVVLSTANGQAIRAALVSHLDTSADEVFRITKTFVDNLPPEFQFPIANRNAGGIVLKAGASIKIHTIKTGDALGRGGRLNFLHFTEASQYVDAGVDGENAFRAINGALYKDASSCVFIESTANGRDPFFYEKIAAAMDGRNDFRVVFLPWFLEPTYRLSWEDYRRGMRGGAAGIAADPGPRFNMTEEEQQLCDLLKHPVAPGAESYTYQTDLSIEQLTWRRMMLRNELGGSLPMWSKEYPSTWREAFTSTDTGMFSPEDCAYYAGEIKDPVWTGNVVLDGATPLNSRAEFVEHPAGLVRVWAKPDGISNYLISADTAAARGMDYSVAYVIRQGDMRIVAAVRGQHEWEAIAECLFGLGLYYGKALVAVEVNSQPAVVDWLAKESYPNLYYYTPIWSAVVGKPNKPGFRTDNVNRKRMLGALGEVVRTRRLVSNDRNFADEMQSFILDVSSQKYAAAPGKHDDCIMAAAIGVLLTLSMEPKARVSGPLRPGESESERTWDLWKGYMQRNGTGSRRGPHARGNRW